MRVYVCVHTHTHSSLYYINCEVSKPNFKRLFFFWSLRDKFVYVWCMYVSERERESARWCGTNEFKKVVYVYPKMLIYLYFAISPTSESVWCLFAKIAQYRGLLPGKNISCAGCYFLHAIILINKRVVCTHMCMSVHMSVSFSFTSL